MYCYGFVLTDETGKCKIYSCLLRAVEEFAVDMNEKTSFQATAAFNVKFSCMKADCFAYEKILVKFVKMLGCLAVGTALAHKSLGCWTFCPAAYRPEA